MLESPPPPHPLRDKGVKDGRPGAYEIDLSLDFTRKNLKLDKRKNDSFK